MSHNLDLRGIACPMNFVKTRLYLDTLAGGEILTVILDAGEPIESVHTSVIAEGHKVDNPQIKDDGSYLLTITKIATLLLLSFYCFASSSAWSQTNALGGHSLPNKTASPGRINPNSQPAAAVQEQIKLAKENVSITPLDIAKRLHLARLLRHSGNNKEAAIEYLNITSISPSCVVADHEMIMCNPSIGQIDEAIARLIKLDESKPNQLYVKMGLSELYEQKNDYYRAARVLVDLQYSQNIPPKFVPQIDSRIHMLLGKTKDVRTTEKAVEHKTNIEVTDSSSSSIPMPDVTVTTDAPTNKLRNTQVKGGYGHAQLLP